jgi:hypothetical protein
MIVRNEKNEKWEVFTILFGRGHQFQSFFYQIIYINAAKIAWKSICHSCDLYFGVLSSASSHLPLCRSLQNFTSDDAHDLRATPPTAAYHQSRQTNVQDNLANQKDTL